MSSSGWSCGFRAKFVLVQHGHPVILEDESRVPLEAVARDREVPVERAGVLLKEQLLVTSAQPNEVFNSNLRSIVLGLRAVITVGVVVVLVTEPRRASFPLLMTAEATNDVVHVALDLVAENTEPLFGIRSLFGFSLLSKKLDAIIN
ncbi:MAG: hypothetical protein JWN12_214 [Candidatus Saccharibacteria bacterium]|nr:hypothetical protein [Candidatus Saccharibacteria bacterium]